MADTRLGKIGITVKEPWSENISYEVLDMSLFAVENGGDGCSYVALRNNIGVTPGTDPTTWVKSTQAGQSIYDLAVKYHHFVGTEEEFEAEYQAALQAARDAAAGASAVEAQVEAAETARVAAENARVSAESARASAETGRESAESARQTAEAGRSSAEAGRDSAETARVTAEQGRASAESDRVSAEAARTAAEADRVSDFSALKTDMETAIGQADAATAAAVATNNQIQTAETGRVSAEQGRVSAESSRASAEQARAAAETARVTAEGQRANAESQRATAEQARATAETARETQAASDHTRAESDHATASGDHTQAGTDHSTALADHVTASADHETWAGYRVVVKSVGDTAPATPSSGDKWYNTTDNKIYSYDGSAWDSGVAATTGATIVNSVTNDVYVFNGSGLFNNQEEVSQLGQEVNDKLDAPEETSNEYLRVYLDSEGKILFAITAEGKVLLNGGVGLTNIDYTAEDKLVVRATRHIENPEWIELVTDSNGTILYGVKADGKLSGNGEKSLSTNDYTNKDKNVVSLFNIIEHPEFSFLISYNNVPLFGLKRDGTLYPNVVGGLEALKKDVLKHRVHFDEPIEETFVLPDSYNNVIATMYSYILEEIIVENTPYFHFSKDLGDTWVTVPNTIGDITHAHIFSDGTFLLCGRRKAYHTKDFETITESTIYDADGSVITELSRDSFFTLGHHDVYNVVDGKEIEIWGEYVLDRNQNPKIWYTIDNGVTVRSAFTFGVSEIDGSVVDCRHIHKVTYCKKDNTFYATTGDAYSSNEDHVLAGNINVNNNTWEWRHIADGRMFKFGVPFFDDVFMYAITDYTEAALYDQKGLLYTPISGIEQINSDISKFNYVYRFPVDEALTDTGLVMAPFDMVIDGGENKILFGDYQASGFLWFANKGYGFKRYRLSKKMLLGLNIIGPNFNGDIYTQAFGDGVTYTNEYFKLNRSRGYNLTEIFRSNGIEDFMKQLNTKYNF